MNGPITEVTSLFGGTVVVPVDPNRDPDADPDEGKKLFHVTATLTKGFAFWVAAENKEKAREKAEDVDLDWYDADGDTDLFVLEASKEKPKYGLKDKVENATDKTTVGDWYE